MDFPVHVRNSQISSSIFLNKSGPFTYCAFEILYNIFNLTSAFNLQRKSSASGIYNISSKFFMHNKGMTAFTGRLLQNKRNRVELYSNFFIPLYHLHHRKLLQISLAGTLSHSIIPFRSVQYITDLSSHHPRIILHSKTIPSVEL